MNKIEICQRIVKNKQFEKITVQNKHGKNKKVVLDMFTASKIVNIYNQVEPGLQKKMESLKWQTLLTSAFKLG